MKRQQASYDFQAPHGYRVGEPHPSSMPLEPGARVRVGQLGGTFEVLAFDGSTYRLRSETGAELRAGRRAVQEHTTRSDP